MRELYTNSSCIVIKGSLVFAIYILFADLTVIFVEIVTVTRKRRDVTFFPFQSVTECLLPRKAYERSPDIRPL